MKIQCFHVNALKIVFKSDLHILEPYEILHVRNNVCFMSVFFYLSYNPYQIRCNFSFAHLTISDLKVYQ